MPLGILRTVVPAAPDAWITALARLRHDVVRRRRGAAIRYAREGFAVFEYMATMITEYEDGYRSWPSNAAIFLPGGKVPKVGDRFVQTDLAGTLQYMVDQERAAAVRGGRLAGLAAARAAFYCGDIAETIVRYHEQNGGCLARDDLAELPQPLRGAGQGPLARLRGLYLRAVVPGPDAGAGAAHDRGGGRPRRAAAQQRRLRAPHHRDPEGGLRRPRVSLRRSAVRRCRPGRAAVGRARQGEGRRDRHAARHARHAAAGRALSGERASADRTVDGAERRRRRARHLLLLRGRPLGQRHVGDAERRLVALAGDPGPRHRAVRPRHAIAARPEPSRPAWRPASGRGSRPTRRSRCATTAASCRSARRAATCRCRRCCRCS